MEIEKSSGAEDATPGRRGWLAARPAPEAATPGGNAAAGPRLRFGHLWIEALIFVLLLCTGAALVFRGALVDRHLSLDPTSAGERPVYSYSDVSSGGKSQVEVTDPGSWRWTCRIALAYAYPFCGFGIELHRGDPARGIDLSGYDKVTLDISYQGPGDRLRLSFRNRDLVDGHPVEGEEAKPVGMAFDVGQGRQTVEIALDRASVEGWWSAQHAAQMPRAGEPRLDNVVAIDVQTPAAPAPGTYRMTLHRVALDGTAFTAAQWYLLIIGVWIAATALLLVYRLVTLRRTLAARQRLHLQHALYLESARHAAESASAAKSRFLAHMSHELRTPLNAILGYAQMLRTAAADERQRRAAGTIHESGEHLLALITDILDHSKIAAGKLELEIASFDLRAMVRAVVEMIRGRAEEQGLCLKWRIASDVPQRLVGDQKHLRQVLINLLGNAVKFTPQGEVALDVGVVAHEGGDVRLRFEVRDTGLGIADDQQALVFRPFEQAGNAAGTTGTGLGLSISKQLVELMGGTVDFVSRSGEGSRFWFDVTLPLGESHLLAQGPVEESTAAADTRVIAPPAEALEAFLVPARTGNMRAIRAEAEALAALHPEYRDFCAHVGELARNFQSAKLLELIERHLQDKLAA